MPLPAGHGTGQPPSHHDTVVQTVAAVASAAFPNLEVNSDQASHRPALPPSNQSHMPPLPFVPPPPFVPPSPYVPSAPSYLPAAPPQHGEPRHFDPITGDPVNSHGRPYQAPPPPGARGVDGGSRASYRRREKMKATRQQQMRTRATACPFASLPDMLAAAAAESEGLKVDAVAKMLQDQGCNEKGLFKELATGGDDPLLRLLEELGITALGHRRAILRVLKFEAS